MFVKEQMMDLGIRLYFKNKTVYISQKSMQKKNAGNEEIFQLQYENIDIDWRFSLYRKGFLIFLRISTPTTPKCQTENISQAFPGVERIP